VEAGQALYVAAGCPSCGNTGYQGRIGIYEAVRIDERMRRLISENADESVMAQSLEGGAGTLSSAARARVLDGSTTVEEAVRVTRQERDSSASV
ncbi:MAG TPA: type II secretion system protein GspE, partial [Caulobacter sp.]|nr:type II secretion system protein GspE [Caulobacter sp.]